MRAVDADGQQRFAADLVDGDRAPAPRRPAQAPTHVQHVGDQRQLGPEPLGDLLVPR